MPVQKPWLVGIGWAMGTLLLLNLVACSARLPDMATPTARATQTPRPTFTPSPTCTPTPPPTPTPLPLEIQVRTDPPQVVQAHTVTVWVTGNRPITATGVLSGTPLTFVWAGPDHAVCWAVAGIDFYAAEGAYPVQVTATDDLARLATQTLTLTVVAASYPIEHVQLVPGRASLLAPDIVRAELARINPVYAEVAPVAWWSGVFTRPITTTITSVFGVRRAYNGGPPGGYHGGVDFRGEIGHPVRAAAAGRIALAEELKVRGNMIIIDHGMGVHTGYCHLAELKVQAGDWVEQGQVIGLVGDTGLVSGSHLHWELRIAGVIVDPLEWTERAFP